MTEIVERAFNGILQNIFQSWAITFSQSRILDKLGVSFTNERLWLKPFKVPYGNIGILNEV